MGRGTFGWRGAYRLNRMGMCGQNTLLLGTVALVGALGAGCNKGPAGSGSFERTLTVTGAVRLELDNGSGDVRISTGPAGQVRIHGDFRLRPWPWENVRQRVEDLTRNPPIEQRGNLIRVGQDRYRLRHARVDYTISVPAETELRARTGSGGLEVRGVRGRAHLETGSGDITAETIGSDAEASTGSGAIHLSTIEGEVQASTGSGEIRLENIRGHIRLNTGSGDIEIRRPGGRVIARTGSGDIEASGVSGDLRISTGSGDLHLEGKPRAESYWDLDTGSGDVKIDVPEDASFRLHARTTSGDVETKIPLVIEEKTKHELRARTGKAEARIEVRTASGSIRVR